MNIKHLLIGTSLIAALSIMPVEAQRPLVSQEVITDSIQQLEIMVGNRSGNLQLEKEVTRAEFATMLVAASPYKNVTTHFGYTLFPDVLSSHWSSGYIKVVVEQGYMLGQVNGNFAPDRPVVLEEAVTAVLCLLGYTNDTLSGTYPQAQLAKYYELELDEYMNVQTGEALTREDCMYLFFNLMNCNNINNSPYASQLGHSVTADGSLDTMALTEANTQGPFLVGNYDLPEDVYQVDTVYKNDKLSTNASFEKYDVCYYNEKLDTVWIYDEKVTGRLISIDSLHSPSVINVSGNDYVLESSAVKYKFSLSGSIEEGDIITLLLGQNGEVADVMEASITDSTLVGVVLENGVKEFPDGTNSTTYSRYVTLVTTAGDVVTIDTSGTYSPGRMIQVSYQNGEQTIRSLTDKKLEATVSSNGLEIGSYKLADNVEIIEFYDSKYQKLYPAEIANAVLEEGDVRYYTTNPAGEITSLILEDVTGANAQFVYITSTTTYPTSAVSTQTVYHYRYLGESYTNVATGTVRPSEGGFYFNFQNGNVSEMEELTELKLSKVNSLNGTSAAVNYPIAEDVQVYEAYGNGAYYLTTISNVSDTKLYDLTAYYDEDLFPAGGKIRIIVAEPKE